MPLTISPAPNAYFGAPPTEMAQALRNLQHAVTQCHDAVFMTDSTGIISRVNPAFEKMSGYSSLEAVGKDFSLLIAKGPHSNDYRRVWGRIFEHRVFTGEVELKDKSNRCFPVEMTVTPVLDGRSQISSLVCTCREGAAESVRTPAPNIPQAKNETEVPEKVAALQNVLISITAQANLAFESVPPDNPLKSRLRAILKNCRSASEIARLIIAEEGLPNKANAAGAR